MKKSFLGFASAAALLTALSPAAQASQNNANSQGPTLVTGSNYVLYHRGEVSKGNASQSSSIWGTATAPLSKGQHLAVNSNALAALKQSPDFSQMKSAFDSGKLVIVEGNTDNNLSSALLRQVFQAPGPIVQHQFKNNPNAYVYAEGIVRLPGESMPSLFDIIADKGHPWTDQEVISTMLQLQQHAESVLAENNTRSPSTLSKNGTIQPDSYPGGSNGNYSYFASVENVYENGGIVAGQYRYGYYLNRKYTNGSNLSEWVLKLDDGIDSGSYLYNTGQMTSGVDSMSQISAVWTSAGCWNAPVSENYTNEHVENGSLSEVYNSSQSKEDGSMSVTLSNTPSITWTFPFAYNSSDMSFGDYSKLDS